ncbi:Zinc finger protein ZAT4 [Bienertia sinuspersici]
MNQNQSKRSNFVRNNSHSSVSEVVEAEHASKKEVVVAMCLIVLSQDMGSWGNISSTSFTATATESSENNSLHHGLKLKGVEVSANGLCSNDKNNKSSSESKRKREKVQSKESDFTVTDHAEKSAKVESVASGYVKDELVTRSLWEVANVLPQPCLNSRAEIDTDDVDQSTEVQQQTQSQQKQELVANNMVIGSSSSSPKKVVQKHECPICYRVFSSGQALGGHKRSHLLVASTNNAEINNGRNSEVQINSQNSRIVDVVERLSSSENRDLLDLNFPPTQDETATTVSSSNSLVGFTKPYWCVESSYKHEPLLGLISN